MLFYKYIFGLFYCVLFDFREESSLVEQFIFEVLVIFVESLALAHSDERSLGNCSSTSDLWTGQVLKIILNVFVL